MQLPMRAQTLRAFLLSSVLCYLVLATASSYARATNYDQLVKQWSLSLRTGSIHRKNPHSIKRRQEPREQSKDQNEGRTGEKSVSGSGWPLGQNGQGHLLHPGWYKRLQLRSGAGSRGPRREKSRSSRNSRRKRRRSRRRKSKRRRSKRRERRRKKAPFDGFTVDGGFFDPIFEHPDVSPDVY